MIHPDQTHAITLLIVVFSEKRSIIDIWQDSKYGCATSFFNIFFVSLFGYLRVYINVFFLFSESLQLSCSCDANQKYYITFHWFQNHLLYINHENTKFSYICAIEMRKSLLWKTSRWSARLISTNNKNNNKNYNKNYYN